MPPRKGTKKPRAQRKKRVAKSTRFRDVHSFKLTGKEMTVQQGTGGLVSTGTGVGIGNVTVTGNLARFGGVMGIAVANTNQWTQLNTLFDRYKIVGVKYTFYPSWNVNTSAMTTNIPTMKLVHDYDDANVPRIGDVWARQGRLYRLNKPVSIFVRPKVATAVFSGSGSYGYSVQKAPYINCAYSGLPHYALKFAVKDWPDLDDSAILRIEATYYVTFREQINIGALGHEEPSPENEESAPILEQEEEVACELKPTS